MLLSEMEIFYHVAAQHSFSKAALHLGVSKSLVSKAVTRLETAVKAKLLTRSTRNMTLTEAGQALLPQCEQMLKAAEQGYDNIHALQGKPTGTLKISVPFAFALNILDNMLPDFISRYPDIQLEIYLDNKIVNLVKEGYDLAIRSTQLADSNLIAKKLLLSENLLCATANYLNNHGTPATPNDLTQHQFALYSGMHQDRQLTFTQNKQCTTVHITQAHLCNSVDLIKQLTLAHSTIAILPDFMVQSELASKKLIHCLPKQHLPSYPVYAIYPERALMPPKLQVFLEHLKCIQQFLVNN